MKVEPGYTPGPWAVDRIDYELHGLDASFEVTAGRRVIVQTQMREIRSEGVELATDEANCRLIAAAPSLVKALQEAIALLDDCEISHPLRWEAALTLALGEQS